MNKIFCAAIVALLVFTLPSCKHQKAPVSTTVSDAGRYSGGGGTSFDDAVIINATTEGDGIDAEYDWLNAHYPGYKLISQALSSSNGKRYDVMSIKTADGKEITVYFNIDNYFGKWLK
jgi:hypothetical protein